MSQDKLLQCDDCGNNLRRQEICLLPAHFDRAASKLLSCSKDVSDVVLWQLHMKGFHYIEF